MADNTSQSEKAPLKPGDNPNKNNALPRKGARPQKKNSPNGSSQSMRLGWIDPLPQVDVIHPLGLEPNPEAIPAGEVELDFDLPETISRPFCNTVHSIGDRIMLGEDEKEEVADSLLALAYFKAARQLYSTMLDVEKSANQPLKAVYYDETPIPLHMAGALGIIGHMDTKVGQVLVKDAGVLFKRWVSKGLQLRNPATLRGNPSRLVWTDRESFRTVQRLAREEIASLVKQTYTVLVDGAEITVSMPQLQSQDLDVYFNSINNRVPNADDLRHCVAALQMTYRQFERDDDIPHNTTRADILDSLRLEDGTIGFPVATLRDLFEDFVATYTTDVKWRIESIFKVGPPPAGSTGYGAQTVESGPGNTARWQFPLSDADVNIGYLFNPSKAFNLHPRLVGYSRRSRETAASQFANQDAKQFARD